MGSGTRRIPRWVRAATIVSVAWAPAVLALGVPGAEPAAAPVAASAEQVRQWVRALDSERFLEREVATEKLIAVGGAAIGPVVEALAGNNLEVTTRGMHILQELALSPDAAVEEAAHQALERIAAPRVTALARRAAATLARLEEARRDRALQELKQLGAVVTATNANMFVPMAERCRVELGDQWRGTDKDLARLRWLRGVGELVLLGPQVTDAWLAYVVVIEDLPTLTVKHAKVTDEGLRHLARLKKLQLLRLLYVPIGDKAVPHFTGLQGISTLHLYGTRISESGAEELRQALRGTKVDYRHGGFLGIGCEAVPQGCMIFTVRPNSAAEKAGLMVNDVVLEYAGKPVPDFTVLTNLIATNQPGDRVTLKILRGQSQMVKQVTLGEWEVIPPLSP